MFQVSFFVKAALVNDDSEGFAEFGSDGTRQNPSKYTRPGLSKPDTTFTTAMAYATTANFPTSVFGV